MRRCSLALTALVFATVTAHAQACSATSRGTCTATVTITISDVLVATPSAFSPTTPAAADYQAGTTFSGSVLVQANRNWKLDLVGSGTPVSNFVFTQPTATVGTNPTFANPAKPATNAKWSATGTPAAGSTQSLGASASVAATGTPGSTTQPVNFRVNWRWSLDTPGSYTITPSFTLTTR